MALFHFLKVILHKRYNFAKKYNFNSKLYFGLFSIKLYYSNIALSGHLPLKLYNRDSKLFF